MSINLAKIQFNAAGLSEIFSRLKIIYNFNEIREDRKSYIIKTIKKYGYLPYPHIKILEEFTPAETILGIEEKLKLNKVYSGNNFTFNNNDEISPVKRAGFSNSSWLKIEQHSIKLINLAGLGSGNSNTEPGKFIDWLKQLLILPAGNLSRNVLGTTMYLIPFHPRDFGCAYLPTSSDVSPNLEDKLIFEKLQLNAKKQVQLFILLSQLAGHPVMYDVLPQTGRFSKIILANPYIARWFDVKELIEKLDINLSDICEKLKNESNLQDIDKAKQIISNHLLGKYETISDNLTTIISEIETRLDKVRKQYSEEMLTKENQEKLHIRVKKIINIKDGNDENKHLTEEDINNQGAIIGELISNGLWPAPGGAWCSSGIPIFSKMSEGAGFPLFKHHDNDGKDVTDLANLDCQTPYYFVYLESGKFNKKVITFYIDFLKKLQSDFNFDGFRVDHIDHIVDKVSEDKDGNPISYRAPRVVLGKANEELKKVVPHFACLAEYMLWENFYKEYHQDMNFDLLWGNDIVSQYLKNITRIIEDNKELEKYNSELAVERLSLSFLKTYNNQDGEFRAIDQYPGQLGTRGALFKWFKLKFLPGGKLAQRPVLYIDGDESFTKVGIEKVIGSEESMIRNNNFEFFKEFDAISRFAINNDLTRYGVAELLNSDKEGFASWTIKGESNINERLLIIANENAPTEVIRKYDKEGNLEIENKISNSLSNKKTLIPEGFEISEEYIFDSSQGEFITNSSITNVQDNSLVFDNIEPSQYHIYKITRK